MSCRRSASLAYAPFARHGFGQMLASRVPPALKNQRAIMAFIIKRIKMARSTSQYEMPDVMARKSSMLVVDHGPGSSIGHRQWRVVICRNGSEIVIFIII